MVDEISLFVEKELEDYLAALDDHEDSKDAIRFHKTRFEKSLIWIASMDPAGKRVLELGSESVTTRLIRGFFPTCTLQTTDFEFRRPFPLEDSTFDLVICMEVIEHVFDLEILQATTFSGVNHVLQEIYRILRPGGQLFLTTPNASSTWIIQRALLNQPPLAYEHHFREFTFQEINSLVESAGLEIVEAKAEQVWAFWDFEHITDFMSSNGYSLENRGDDTFLVARK